MQNLRKKEREEEEIKAQRKRIEAMPDGPEKDAALAALPLKEEEKRKKESKKKKILQERKKKRKFEDNVCSF